jgi:hypothetical protein
VTAKDFWLADTDARVLGPVNLEVVRDLALRGKLADVRAVSRDGKTFVPVREVPEIQQALSVAKSTDALAFAQADATKQIRDWLTSIRGRSSEEVFRVPQNGSREAWRAAFFSLIYRYVPGRLPPEATPELRLACEDAFLALSERMVDLERQFRASKPSPSTASMQTTSLQVRWRGGMIHVRLILARGDLQPFTADPENTWQQDCLFVGSAEKLMINTPADITIGFEGHVTQIHSSGRVVGVRTTPALGFSVKLLDLGEAQRAMIRTWVARAS